MSNFPLRYKLSWLPRFAKPSLAGRAADYTPMAGRWLPDAAKTVRLVFVGDISAVANSEPPEIDATLRAILASADLVVGNCESPVVEKPRSPLATKLGTRHAMTPQFLSEAIDAAGIEPRKLVLSLANNHMLDQGAEGFAETRAALGQMGIATIGAMEDGFARTIDLEGLAIAFAAFTEWRNASRQDFAGRVTMLDDLARDDFSALRAKRADLTCVVAHWDWEFRHVPRPSTRTLARRLADSGAGLVVGHHAHVVQPVEQIGETLVAYGLGDFLGTAMPRQPWPGRIGAILAVDVSADAATRGKIAGYQFHPFLRVRQRRNERLLAAGALEGRIGRKVETRLAAIFGAGGEA